MLRAVCASHHFQASVPLYAAGPLRRSEGGIKTRSRPERSGGSARPGFRPNGTAAAFPPLLAGQKRQNRCSRESTNTPMPRACKKTGARKGITHTRQKPLAESHRTGNLPPDSYGVNLSSPRAFPIPGGVKKMMRAADRLPCCALCALRIIFKPPFRFMPRVRCVGVRAE